MLKGLPFLYVTVHAFGGLLGHVAVEFDGRRWHDLSYCGSYLEMLASGPAAEQLVTGVRCHWSQNSDANDLRKADAMLRYVVGGLSVPESHDRIWRAAETLVTGWAPAITRVALALVERRTLEEVEVRRELVAAVVR